MSGRPAARFKSGAHRLFLIQIYVRASKEFAHLFFTLLIPRKIEVKTFRDGV